MARIFVDMANHDLIIHSLCTVMMNGYQFSRPSYLFGLPFLNKLLNFMPYGEYNLIQPTLQSLIGFKSYGGCIGSMFNQRD